MFFPINIASLRDYKIIKLFTHFSFLISHFSFLIFHFLFSIFHLLMFLFLDRDGVINKRIVGDYVRNLSQCEWQPQAAEAIALLSQYFERILVITNQQGVGKGYFSMENVAEIHAFIAAEIADKGGKIAAFYVCPHLKTDNCDCRKPQIGMALQAKKDFPEIDFSQSVMVGDSLSDMEFGRNAGMKTVFIATDGEKESPLIDEMYENLWEFAEDISRRVEQI